MKWFFLATGSKIFTSGFWLRYCTIYMYQTKMSRNGTSKTDLSQCSADKEARVATLRLRRNDDVVVYISRIGCLRLCIWDGLLRHSWLGRWLDGVCYVCVSVRPTADNANAIRRACTPIIRIIAVTVVTAVVVTPADSRQFTFSRTRCRWRRWCWSRRMVSKMVVVDRQCNIHHRINNRKHYLSHACLYHGRHLLHYSANFNYTSNFRSAMHSQVWS